MLLAQLKQEILENARTNSRLSNLVQHLFDCLRMLESTVSSLAKSRQLNTRQVYGSDFNSNSFVLPLFSLLKLTSISLYSLKQTVGNFKAFFVGIRYGKPVFEEEKLFLTASFVVMANITKKKSPENI